MFKLVEKDNHAAVHGIFSSYARARRHLEIVIPLYCSLGYYTDKTLTPLSFIIIWGEGRS